MIAAVAAAAAIAWWRWPEPQVVYPEGLDPAKHIDSGFASWVDSIGRRRIYRHEGLDFMGPKGQPVIAAAAGEVLSARTDRCAGPTVLIDHGWDKHDKPLIAVYTHLGEILVKPHTQVRRGELIARLGDNYRYHPCAAGVRHLHFEVGRKAVDRGVNPHPLWADGPYRVSCFEPGRTYASGTLTLPIPCGTRQQAAPTAATAQSGSKHTGG